MPPSAADRHGAAPATRIAGDVFEFLLLAALWGGSFILMRYAAPEFGPVALIEIRVAIAALVLSLLIAVRRPLSALRPIAGPLLLVGVLNSALPFTLFAYATLTLTAGLSSILNATAPMFGALVGCLWLGDRLSLARVAGLILGFGGVVILVWGKGGAAVPAGSVPAIAAALLAAFLYGVAANYTRRRFVNVRPLDIAAGSQLGAALALLPPALLFWPDRLPGAGAWAAVTALALGCTALAYLLYFRLLARHGVTRAITVTYLIPVFGMLWGWLFLAEPVTLRMVAGCTVILAGTALATGVPLRRGG